MRTAWLDSVRLSSKIARQTKQIRSGIDRGMSTAEYAVGTIAAVAFAAVSGSTSRDASKQSLTAHGGPVIPTSGSISGVAVEKVSVSLDSEVLADTRGRVGGRGLSAYVNNAVRRQLRRDALSDLLVELRVESGPVPAERMEEVRRLWPAPGADGG